VPAHLGDHKGTPLPFEKIHKVYETGRKVADDFKETMRATLNTLATVAPDWLQQIAPVAWYDRYETRTEEWRLPRRKQERETWVKAVGQDGLYLLSCIYELETHRWLWEVPAVQILRQVWLHQFYHLNGASTLRKAEDLPPASIRFDSPYDPQALYSTKRQTHWTGYKVHITFYSRN
jgi:transposase